MGSRSPWSSNFAAALGWTALWLAAGAVAAPNTIKVGALTLTLCNTDYTGYCGSIERPFDPQRCGEGENHRRIRVLPAHRPDQAAPRHHTAAGRRARVIPRPAHAITTLSFSMLCATGATCSSSTSAAPACPIPSIARSADWLRGSRCRRGLRRTIGRTAPGSMARITPPTTLSPSWMHSTSMM